MEATGRRLCAVGGLILLMLSRSASAQDEYTPHRAFVLGLTGAGMIGELPFGDMLGVGGLFGLEQHLSKGISVRALTSLLRGVDTADDVSICFLGPDGECLSRLSPHWLSTVEVNVVLRLFPGVPVSLLGGGGWSFASDARENWRGAPRTDSGTETQAVWRWGLHIRLGSSPRSPRLQLTRARFGSDPFSLSRIDALTILLRP